MFIAILTLLSALSISGVAIFYSVIGLATIFPGAFVPVVIMGSVLEVGKLITASWLYRHWHQTRFLLKLYLTTAVVVISLITSMGIFGFLSKAHLEQNLQNQNLTQKIELINSKIVSQETYIKRQNAVIERAEKSLTRTTGSNDEAIAIERQNLEDAQNKLKIAIELERQNLTDAQSKLKDAIELEKQSLKDVQDKFKTLLAVETNTLKNYNDSLKILDKMVSDVLNAKKSFFNEEKAAKELKASQRLERDEITRGTQRTQRRIEKLKEDYTTDTAIIQARIEKLRQEVATETAVIQKRIEKLRQTIATETVVIQTRIENLRVGSVDDKSGVNAQIETAEDNISNAQNNIDDLIIDREPLESAMIKLEAEVGPIKYIAALVVDWGVTDEVELNEAVRWVILLIIVVFDPLAVALLLAANQSLMRRFPVEPLPPPQEIADFEKPDPYEPPLAPVKDKAEGWNDMVAKANALAEQEKQEKIQKDWDVKLYEFNKERLAKRDKEIEKEVEETIPHVDLKSQKKTKKKEKVVVNEDGFNEDEVAYDVITPAPEPKVTTVEKALKMPESESVETPIEDPTISEQIEEVMEPERLKPDFTEVLVPEKAVTGNLGVIVTKDKKVIDTIKPKAPKSEPDATSMTDFERTDLLNKLHQQHGKYEDVDDSVLKEERDEANKAQFLADVGVTEEDARNHPPITASRKAFFEDHIDDVLRGNSTVENLPPDIAKTIAILLSEYNDPDTLEEGSALIPENDKNVETMTTEGLKEKFMERPEIEDRPITDEELDKLLDGFEKPKEKGYVQNEEQTDETLWQKTKELDLPEPEKNELILPDLKSTTEDIAEIADKIDVKVTIPTQKFAKHKNRFANDDEYRQRIEQRINDLITKLENNEIELNDLTNNDQKVIMDILNQNG